MLAELTLWLDSSVAYDTKRTRELSRAASGRGVRTVVHAHVHLEQCRQMRIAARAAFSASRIDSFLSQQGIEVATAVLDRGTAEAFAEQLSTRYPSYGAWQEAKRSAVRATLPNATIAARVPMTADWLIALEVERCGARIAVEDKGEEWNQLRALGRALSFDEALTWLEGLPPAAPVR